MYVKQQQQFLFLLFYCLFIYLFICTHSFSKINYDIENIKGKNKLLEYWLPGIAIGASGARQPVDISIK